jgi:hypothetical protein
VMNWNLSYQKFIQEACMHHMKYVVSAVRSNFVDQYINRWALHIHAKWGWCRTCLHTCVQPCTWSSTLTTDWSEQMEQAASKSCDRVLRECSILKLVTT